MDVYTRMRVTALAVARRELLARWQPLLLDRTLSRETRDALRRARNALQDHLQPADLTGALRDKLGVPVRASGSGKAWEHLDEVDGALRSFEHLNRALRRELHRVPSDRQALARLSREKDALAETFNRLNAFLEIR